MPGKPVSPRRLSVSDRGKKLLKEKRRREKHALADDEVQPTTKGLWIVVIAAFIVFAIVAWFAASRGA